MLELHPRDAGGGRVLRAHETGPRHWTIQSKRHCACKCRRYTEKCLFHSELRNQLLLHWFQGQMYQHNHHAQLLFAKRHISVYYLQQSKKSYWNHMGGLFWDALSEQERTLWISCSISLTTNFRYVICNYLYFLKGFSCFVSRNHNIFFISALPLLVPSILLAFA